MHNHDEDYPPADVRPGQQTDRDRDMPPARPGPSASRNPRFPEYDEEDDYEEPDRDTDSASFYPRGELEDDVFEEEDFEPDEFEEDDLEEDSEPEYFEEDDLEEDFNPEEFEEERLGEDENATRRAPGTSTSIWDFEDAGDTGDTEVRDERNHDLAASELTDESPRLAQRESGGTAGAFAWREEDLPEQEQPEPQKWPLGMVIVGVVAVLLLAAGGYGVIQQRSAMEEEIRQLQASLAVAVSPEEVAGSRAAVEKAERRGAELQAALDALTLDNQRLTDTVTGLEAQLQAQQEALARQEASAKKAEAAPPPAKIVKPAPKTTPTTSPTTSVSGGDWFVNFGSYSVRATAESWAAKLHPGAGRVVVSTGSREGDTFYRVRVVDLASHDQAESLARELEREHGLSKLWVGRQ